LRTEILQIDDAFHATVLQTRRSAAALVVDEFITSGQIVALGTGEVIGDILAELARRQTAGALHGVRCVPSSDAAAAEAALHGVPLTTLPDAGGTVDIVIDVADQLDCSDGELTYIVGRGNNGPQAGLASLPRLRRLFSRATHHVVMATEENTVRTQLFVVSKNGNFLFTNF
jgi:hypothetical protein